MLNRFPENKYPPLSRYAHEYNRHVRRGRLLAKQSQAVICGLARNVADVLPKTIARIEATGRMFGDYRVVIYENDSHDSTVEQLRQWQADNPLVTVLSESLGLPINPGNRCLERAARMAMFRNAYREFVNAHFADFEYALVVDTDLLDGWSYDGLANTMGHSNWDFMGSNGLIHIQPPHRPSPRVVYYDAWAFRSYGRPDPHTAGEVNPMVFSRGQPLLPVTSCFGGLGVYRMAAFQQCRYEGTDCEHVPFHQQMRACGLDKLYLNPSQIVLYGTRTW